MPLLTDEMREAIQAALARYGQSGEALRDPHEPSPERREEERRWAKARYDRKRQQRREEQRQAQMTPEQRERLAALKEQWR